MASLGDSVRDVRDRALLLVGFAGAFRRSERSRVDCKSIKRTPRGIVITIAKSKTDQEGQARHVAIPNGRNNICPIQAGFVGRGRGGLRPSGRATVATTWLVAWAAR